MNGNEGRKKHLLVARGLCGSFGRDMAPVINLPWSIRFMTDRLLVGEMLTDNDDEVEDEPAVGDEGYKPLRK